MNRRRFLSGLGTAGFVGVAGCQSTDRTAPSLRYRVGADGFERRSEGDVEALTIRGVNLGMAKPGYFPGSAAIERAEYDRWLSAIGEIANLVRTYTIHPPAFYRALRAYNDDAPEPLLLLQGTWVPTADLLEAGDATALSPTVDRELRRTVEVVHGDTTLPDRPGHASGSFDADVSDVTLGYLFGIEWPPEVVEATDEAGADDDFEGSFVRTTGGSPFEQWLAGRLDTLATHETDTYGVQRPLSFVNWVTTDPLSHPYEPFRNEDRVSVDPDAIGATEDFDAGTFASYHAYPYYPDLLNETPEYVEYTDHRGEPNSYAGYLHDLIGATAQSVVIAEFGVPSSRGIAHRDVHGRDQGRHTEREQGEMVAATYQDILAADAAGGIAFSWQDEWFKRTWNLDARSVPGRRPHWSNVETPEQRFGLLAFESPDGIALDGSPGDWADATVARPAESTDAPDERTLTGLRVSHDLEGLAIRLAFASLPDPMRWDRTGALVTVGLTGRERTLPIGSGLTSTADFVANLGGPDESRLLVESSYDAFAREFGGSAGLDLDAYREGRAGFVPVREPINLGYTVPPTGEVVPFEAVETGRLRYGNGNPDAPDYDSLTDVHVDPANDVVELRLPWLLLNVADPSTRQRIATDWDAGLDVTDFDEVRVAAATYDPRDGETSPSGTGVDSVAHALPGRAGTRLETTSYSWPSWDRPAYEERLKQSYHVLDRTNWGENE
ncbi:membrane lipoprotein [Halorhabdus tiamatea SARL4B]|uniref:Membrane lipoprotein n=1 Tax=Halorhabdus tiamatea SARL4B TaxID=1033806 RepID=F7PNZ5_9EURY|nr:hypothetical protein [Halorhabdus tiamatea]ERJ05341.1 membrane lipoprotein [Halorhabdus tiamatea SARL4B]CCQ33611.1 conserved hypothetical protein [Halorhabdus tiamatea SARL4B]